MILIARAAVTLHKNREPSSDRGQRERRRG